MRKLTDAEADREISVIKEAERQHMEIELLKIKTKIKEFEQEIGEEEALEMRKRYAKAKKKELIGQIKRLSGQTRMGLAICQKSKNYWFWREVVCMLWGEDLDAKIREAKKMDWILSPPKTKNGITPRMIERAREYPIEDLFGNVSRSHFVKCPFHEEKTASAYLKGNYFYCFGCGAHYDTIGLLMARDNLTFPEAVKRLA